MKRIYCLALVVSLAVGCTKKGKSCLDDGDCGDKLSCETVTKTCQATCAKAADCEQGFTCNIAQSVCFSPSDQKTAREKARKEASEKVRSEILASFVSIPEKKIFIMGSYDSKYNNEKPVHTVLVRSFYMSKTEVTVAQYRACVDDGRCSEPGAGEGCNWNVGGREDHPINCVDWGQARTFAKWIGADVDLPTEAEWEYAARGGQDFTYAGSGNPDEVAWYNQNSGGSIHPVGTKKANGYGLYDMSGNVWEWVLDEWHKNYEEAPTVSNEAWGEVSECAQVCDTGSARRVHRGGSWLNGAGGLRVAARNNDLPVIRVIGLGFRLRRTR